MNMEAYPDDNTLLDLLQDDETGVEYIVTGKAPYYLEFRKLLSRLLLACKRANDLRVYSEGNLDIGVKAGKFWDGATLHEYGGSTGSTLADDKASIYVYLDASGTLVTDEYSAWPDAMTRHIRLAAVTTSNGEISDIVDMRGSHLFFTPGSVYGLNGENMAVQDNASGGLPVIFAATLVSGSTVQIHNTDAPYKYRILDAWSVATSADGGTWKLTDGTNEITDTVSVTGTDKTIDRAGTIDDAYHEINTNGSLSVVGDGANADCIVYILAVRVS